MIASFATKQFSVSDKQICTFSGFSFESKLSTEKLETTGQKPRTHIKGEDLSTFKLSLSISVDCGLSPMKEIKDWELILASGTPYIFILGSSQFGKNKYLLNSLAVNETVVSPTGTILACIIELGFEEFVAVGTPKSSETSGTGSNVSPGIAGLAKDDYKANGYSDTERARRKRSIGGERFAFERMEG